MFRFVLRSGIALSSKGGGAGRIEGTVGGIPFKEDLNARGRAAAIRREGPPERARSLRQKGTLRWKRTCLRLRQPLVTGNAVSTANPGYDPAGSVIAQTG